MESAFLLALLSPTPRKPSARIHIHAGPQCAPGQKCLGSGYHGDGSCCLDQSNLLDSCKSLAACHPTGPTQAGSSWGGCPHLSPLSARYPGALRNELLPWEPKSCSGSDRPGSNPSSTT